MKTLIALVLVVAAVALADPAPNGLQTTPQSRGGTIAGQIINQSNAYVQQVRTVLEKGVPAQGENPAVSSQEVKDALGPDNLARIESALRALSAAASGKNE